MATIAKMSINLSATSATLKRDLDASAGHLRGFQRAADSAMKAMDGGAAGKTPVDMKLLAGAENIAKNVAGKLLTLAGAATFANISLSAITTQMQEMDRSGKLADSLQTSTENLQRLRYAAALAGPGIAAADTALEKMLATLGDIRAGSGDEAANVLEKMGLNANTLAAMDPTEAFARIADGINQIPSAADKAHAAMAIFGKGGKDLLPMFAEGSEGLKRMAAEADQLGVSYSRLDAAKIEEANDAITKLELTWTAFVQQLAVAATPAIQVAAQWMTQLTAVIANFDVLLNGNTMRVAAWVATLALTLGAINKYIQLVNMAADALRKLAASQAIVNSMSGPSGWLKLAAGIAISGAAIYAVDQQFQQLDRSSTGFGNKSSAALAATQRAAAQAKGELIELSGAFGTGWMDVIDRKAGTFRVISSAGVTTDTKGLEQAALAKMAELKAAANAPTKEMLAAQKEREEAMQREAEHWRQISERISQSVQTPAEKLKAQLAEIDAALARGVISVDIYGRAVDKAMSEFSKANMKSLTAESKVSIGAVTRNSSAGFSAVQAGRAELAKLEQRAAEQLRLTRMGNTLLADIKENTKQQVTFKRVRI